MSLSAAVPDDFLVANEERSNEAARRRAGEARRALRLFEAEGTNLGSAEVWRKRWIEVLRLRAENEGASLRELGELMDPPMTKNAYAGQLARACRFAARIMLHNKRFSVESSGGVVGGVSYSAGLGASANGSGAVDAGGMERTDLPAGEQR